MTALPFKVGDRVRMKREFRAKHKLKSYEGAVRHITEGSIGFFGSVRIDGVRRFFRFHYGQSGNPCEWELIPLEDWADDTVAIALANAVLAGDIHAARLLADRVMELCGATPALAASSD